jgi:hypothetical protein
LSSTVQLICLDEEIPGLSVLGESEENKAHQQATTANTLMGHLAQLRDDIPAQQKKTLSQESHVNLHTLSQRLRTIEEKFNYLYHSHYFIFTRLTVLSINAIPFERTTRIAGTADTTQHADTYDILIESHNDDADSCASVSIKHRVA